MAQNDSTKPARSALRRTLSLASTGILVASAWTCGSAHQDGALRVDGPRYSDEDASPLPVATHSPTGWSDATCVLRDIGKRPELHRTVRTSGWRLRGCAAGTGVAARHRALFAALEGRLTEFGIQVSSEFVDIQRFEDGVDSVSVKLVRKVNVEPLTLHGVRATYSIARGDGPAVTCADVRLGDAEWERVARTAQGRVGIVVDCTCSAGDGRPGACESAATCGVALAQVRSALARAGRTSGSDVPPSVLGRAPLADVAPSADEAACLAQALGVSELLWASYDVSQSRARDGLYLSEVIGQVYRYDANGRVTTRGFGREPGCETADGDRSGAAAQARSSGFAAECIYRAVKHVLSM
jgi:hypothetical protein